MKKSMIIPISCFFHVATRRRRLTMISAQRDSFPLWNDTIFKRFRKVQNTIYDNVSLYYEKRNK